MQNLLHGLSLPHGLSGGKDQGIKKVVTVQVKRAIFRNYTLTCNAVFLTLYLWCI